MQPVRERLTLVEVGRAEGQPTIVDDGDFCVHVDRAGAVAALVERAREESLGVPVGGYGGSGLTRNSRGGLRDGDVLLEETVRRRTSAASASAGRRKRRCPRVARASSRWTEGARILEAVKSVPPPTPIYRWWCRCGWSRSICSRASPIFSTTRKSISVSTTRSILGSSCAGITTKW